MQNNGRISLISKLETEYLKEILKDLEVLEIINKKEVNIASLKVYDLKEYNAVYNEHKLTKEEYNKVKQWLEDNK